MKSTPKKKGKRAELVNKIKGKYSHLNISSKDLQKPKMFVLAEGYPWVYGASINLTRNPRWSSPGKKIKNLNYRNKIRLIAEVIE